MTFWHYLTAHVLMGILFMTAIQAWSARKGDPLDGWTIALGVITWPWWAYIVLKGLMTR